jgi:hypothetical protein
VLRLRVQIALFLFVCAFAAAPAAGQGGFANLAQDQFFSGTITELTSDSLTVTRTVLGKESSVRTFVITADTRIEGKPRVTARVTVRYVREDEGDRAVHIIVRARNRK